jgi:signal transduction histidine kinase
MALLVLAYKTVQLEAAAEKHEVSWRWCLSAGWRALIRPPQPAARAAHAALLATLSIASLAVALVVYRLWLQPIIPEALFNIAWSIGLMLTLAAFAMSYLVYTPEVISFRVKLTLGTLAAVLISVWILSLAQPFELQTAYNAARRTDVLAVQAEVSRAGSSAANRLPPAVTLLAACPVGPDGAASEPRVLFVREADGDLSGLCGTRFLISDTYRQGRLDTLSILYRFVQDGQNYLVGFAYTAYLQAVTQFTLPIALMMLGSTVGIMLFLPLTFYRNLIRPLHALLTGVQQMNQSRLDVIVPVQSNDEIGLLTRSFNAMAADLRASMAKLENQVTEHLKAEQAVREQQEQLRALTLRLAEAEEIERSNLGRELHDQAGQNLTALSLILKLVRTRLAAGAQEPAMLNQLADHLDDAAELVRQTTQRIRYVMDDLQPPALDEFGLAAALRWSAARFTARTNVAVEVHSPEPAPRLPRPIEAALFRIAQEALTNVARHAQATRVDIQVRVDTAGACLIIDDNGLGFDVRQLRLSDAGGRSSWGLRIMAERAAAIGGACRVKSIPGQGTQIIVEVQT